MFLNANRTMYRFSCSFFFSHFKICLNLNSNQICLQIYRPAFAALSILTVIDKMILFDILK